MIIIAGDSWGVGEWGRLKHSGQPVGLSGPGIGQYFSLHGKVINISEGGSNYARQLEEFSNLLTKFTPGSDDRFYWIVTDPLRNQDPGAVVNDLDTIEQFARSQLDRFVGQINAWATEYDFTVDLIGGLCDLNRVDLSPYDRIKSTVPSWGQLLLDSYATSIFCDECLGDWGEQIHRLRPDLIKEWTDISAQALDKRRSFDLLKEQQLFQYNHPTSLAHIELRNRLAPEYQEHI